MLLCSRIKHAFNCPVWCEPPLIKFLPAPLPQAAGTLPRCSAAATLFVPLSLASLQFGERALLRLLGPEPRSNGGGDDAASPRAGRRGGQPPRRVVSCGGNRRREWRGDQAAEGVPQLPHQEEARRLRRRRRGALVRGSVPSTQPPGFFPFTLYGLDVPSFFPTWFFLYRKLEDFMKKVAPFLEIFLFL